MSDELSKAAVRLRHPTFVRAVSADLKYYNMYRADGRNLTGRLRKARYALQLTLVSDAFLAQACYRAKARLQALRIPVLPHLLHRLAMLTAQVCIGDPVVVQPGLYLAHGQVVVDGFVELGPGTVLFPWVTVGLKAGVIRGPVLGANVHIGTGAKVIGPITLGDGVRVGANAVVLDDVPAHCTVVGMPARPVRRET